jgi:hypothetical protein
VDWRGRLFGMGRGNAAWPAAVEWRDTDSGVSIGAKVMAAVQEVAEKAAAAVATLVLDQPLSPQIARKLAEAEARQAEIEAAIAALALPVLLGEDGAAKKKERLEGQLADIKAETGRLTAALASAIDLEARQTVEKEVAALQEDIARYEGYAAARATAMKDLNEATKVANEAARRFLAATSLMQTATPIGCSLPRGLIIGRDLEVSERAVATENDYVLAAVRSQASTIIRFKRGEEIEHDD